jgi:hypothetical protein
MMSPYFNPAFLRLPGVGGRSNLVAVAICEDDP